MRGSPHLLGAAALLGIMALPALGQSSSPNFGLHDSALAGFGGPSSSASGATSYATLPNAGSGEMTSPSFGSSAGFLETNEPVYPEHPVIFGLDPAFGPKAGGTTLTITGVRFDYLGAAPTVMVFVDGVLANAVTVVSDTLLTCVTDATTAGVHDVAVSSTWGQDLWTQAFASTPAVVGPSLAVAGANMTLANYGTPGGHFVLLWALTETVLSVPPYGILLIGPNIFTLLPWAPYPMPDGVHELTFEVPNDPILDGLQLYFQALAYEPDGSFELTNSSGTTFMAPP